MRVDAQLKLAHFLTKLPPDATVEDVRKVYWLAYKLKRKGMTSYRFGSKKEQVLYIGPLLTKETVTERHVSADSEYSGGCPTTECPSETDAKRLTRTKQQASKVSCTTNSDEGCAWTYLDVNI